MRCPLRRLVEQTLLPAAYVSAGRQMSQDARRCRCWRAARVLRSEGELETYSSFNIASIGTDSSKHQRCGMPIR